MPFGFNLSGSAERSTSTTKHSSEKTTTPIVPDWASTLTQGLVGDIGRLGATDPATYTPGVDPLQFKAGAVANGLSSSPWNYDQAADTLRQLTVGEAPTVKAATARSESLLDGLDRYMSPYKQQVVDAATADFDADAARTRADQTLSIARQGAFGGSGAALTRSLTEGELSRARSTQVSGLLDQMFNRASALSSADADRRQQAGMANADRAQAAGAANANLQLGFGSQRTIAAQGLAGLSADYDANSRANADLMAKLGGTYRDIRQEQARGPLTLADWQIAALGGLDISKFFGESEVANSTEKVKGTKFGLSAGVGGSELSKLGFG